MRCEEEIIEYQRMENDCEKFEAWYQGAQKGREYPSIFHRQ
jgi:hypothetical protein